MRHKFFFLVFVLSMVVLVVVLLPNKYDLLYIYRDDDDTENVARILEELELTSKDPVRLGLERVKIHVSQGQYEVAWNVLDDFKDKASENKNYWQEVYNLSRVSLKRSPMVESLEQLDRLVPGSVQTLDKLLHLYRLEQSYDKSINTLKRLIVLEPTNRKYYEELSSIYLQLRKIPEAIVYLKKHRALFGHEAAVSSLLIQSLTFIGREHEANSLSETISINTTTDISELLRLLKLYHNRDNMDRSQKVYRQLVKQKEGLSSLLDYADSMIYQREKHTLHLLTWLYQRYDDDKRVYTGYISALLQDNNHKTALALYEKRYLNSLSFEKYYQGIQDLYYPMTVDPAVLKKTSEELESLQANGYQYTQGLALMHLYHVQSRLTKEHQLLERLVQINPSQDLVRYHVLSSYDYHDAEDISRLMVAYSSEYPNDNRFCRELAFKFFYEGDFDSARLWRDKITLEAGSELDSELVLLDSLLLAQSKDHVAAVAGYDQLLSRNDLPLLRYAFDYLSSVKALTSTDNRLEHLLTLQDVSTGNLKVDLSFDVLEMYRAMGNENGVMAMQAVLLDIDPSPRVLSDVGWRHFAKAEYKEAHKHFKRAYDKDRSFYSSLSGLASTCFMLKHDDAYRYINAYAKVAPRTEQAVFDLGNMYQSLGKKSRAQKYFENYLSLSKKDPFELDLKPHDVIQKVQQRLTAYYYTDATRKREKLLLRGHKAFPYEPSFIYSILEILYQEKRYSDVLAFIRSLPQSKAFTSKFLREMVSYEYAAMVELGLFDEAHDVLTRLLKHHPEDVSLHFDMISLLRRQNEWQSALSYIQNAWLKVKKDPLKERLFLEEKEILDQYGYKFESEYAQFLRSDFNVGRLSNVYRFKANSKKAIFFHWASSFFSTSDTHTSIGVSHAWYHNPESKSVVRLSYHLGSLSTPGLQFEGTYKALGGKWQVKAQKNAVWDDPIGALTHGGTKDTIALTATYPLKGHFYSRVSGEVSQYYTEGNALAAEGKQASLSVGRPLYMAPSDSRNKLKYLSTEMTYTKSSYTDMADSPLTIAGESSLISVSAYAYFLLNSKSDLELSGLLAGDTDRNIPFGQFKGLSGTYRFRFKPKKYFVFQGEYYSETPVGREPGQSYMLKAKLNIDF